MKVISPYPIRDNLDAYALLSGNNTWTGENYFYNVTVINYTYFNATNFCYLNGTCIEDIFLQSESDPYYFSNPSGYYNVTTLPAYPAEADTLQSVTDRGNTTTRGIKINNNTAGIGIIAELGAIWSGFPNQCIFA
jgi:hypothetical protein